MFLKASTRFVRPTALALSKRQLFLSRTPVCRFGTNSISPQPSNDPNNNKKGEDAKTRLHTSELTATYHNEYTKLKPVRPEFISDNPLTTADLESIPIKLGYHRAPSSIHDHIAFRAVKFLRFFADAFFKKKYIHRAILLETVAGVPGMVAGMTRHLTSLRRMKHDGGWISKLLHEAENERMHLMTWMRITQPKFYERAMVIFVQGIFFNAYFLFYLLAPTTAHRFVGYLEEEAVISYTSFLKEIDNGNIPNTPAPKIARQYWNLAEDATLRDVVLAVRADEAEHRDANHHFSDRLEVKQEDLRKPIQNDSDLLR